MMRACRRRGSPAAVFTELYVAMHCGDNASVNVRTVIAVASTFLMTGCAISDRLSGERQAREVRAVGVPADATVVQIWDTGVTINEDPVVAFLLDVHPTGQASFQAKTKARISRLAVPRIQPGARVRVMFDPKDTTRVALEPIP